MCHGGLKPGLAWLCAALRQRHRQHERWAMAGWLPLLALQPPALFSSPRRSPAPHPAPRCGPPTAWPPLHQPLSPVLLTCSVPLALLSSLADDGEAVNPRYLSLLERLMGYGKRYNANAASVSGGSSSGNSSPRAGQQKEAHATEMVQQQ